MPSSLAEASTFESSRQLNAVQCQRHEDRGIAGVLSGENLVEPVVGRCSALLEISRAVSVQSDESHCESRQTESRSDVISFRSLDREQPHLLLFRKKIGYEPSPPLDIESFLASDQSAVGVGWRIGRWRGIQRRALRFRLFRNFMQQNVLTEARPRQNKEGNENQAQPHDHKSTSRPKERSVVARQSHFNRLFQFPTSRKPANAQLLPMRSTG